jgi:hypothetical protein
LDKVLAATDAAKEAGAAEAEEPPRGQAAASS